LRVALKKTTLFLFRGGKRHASSREKRVGNEGILSLRKKRKKFLGKGERTC